jgi:hypothetical protein
MTTGQLSRYKGGQIGSSLHMCALFTCAGTKNRYNSQVFPVGERMARDFFRDGLYAHFLFLALERA